MASPSMGRLLISHITLRGPEIAQLYAAVATVPAQSYALLMQQRVLHITSDDPFGLDEAPAREALNFLLVARMLTQYGSVRQRATFAVTPHLATSSFSLLLLHHCTHHEDQRQQAISLILRQLVLDDVVAIDLTALRSTLERSPLRDLFAWTSEKLSFWSSLCAYLGVVRRLERSSEILILPQPHLLLAALHWAHDTSGGSESIGVYLDMIDTQLFACLTRRGRLHRGIGQTLETLSTLGAITLTHEADAMHSIIVGGRRISHVHLNQESVI